MSSTTSRIPSMTRENPRNRFSIRCISVSVVGVFLTRVSYGRIAGLRIYVLLHIPCSITYFMKVYLSGHACVTEYLIQQVVIVQECSTMSLHNPVKRCLEIQPNSFRFV